MTTPSADVLDDLQWRGLIAQSTDLAALRAALAAGRVVLYAGFDPTADSLHVGNLVPLLTLRRFQLAGHRPVALSGGATGLVGDPSGRSSERPLISAELVGERVGRLRAQLAHFLELTGPAAATFADNLDWTGVMTAIELLRDVGKHVPVATLLAKDSISSRLEAGGLSFTEFSYVLLQANDFLELHRRTGCTLQVGGSDQWGNITAGLDLIRRVAGVTAHALTVPLVTSSSGAKLGKSTGGGALWLDREMTSPYALYQQLLQTDDRDVGRYLRLLTFLPREEVEDLEQMVREEPRGRVAQRRLAEHVMTLVHGAADLAAAQAASEALFGSGSLADLDERTLGEALEQAPSVRVEDPAPPFVELLAQGLQVSRSEARRAVREGSLRANGRQVQGEAERPESGDWLHGRFLVLRRGTRLVVVERRPGG